MSKVYIVNMMVLIDGEQKTLRTVLRAKSPQAARNQVVNASVSVRRATIDDFVPLAPESAATQESSHE